MLRHRDSTVAGEDKTEDALASIVGRAMPGIIIAAAGGSIPIGIAIVGFLWQQTVSLARMNETLTMVCQQLEEKKAVDREQDRRLSELEKMAATVALPLSPADRSHR